MSLFCPHLQRKTKSTRRSSALPHLQSNHVACRFRSESLLPTPPPTRLFPHPLALALLALVNAVLLFLVTFVAALVRSLLWLLLAGDLIRSYLRGSSFSKTQTRFKFNFFVANAVQDYRFRYLFRLFFLIPFHRSFLLSLFRLSLLFLPPLFPFFLFLHFLPLLSFIALRLFLLLRWERQRLRSLPVLRVALQLLQLQQIQSLFQDCFG